MGSAPTTTITGNNTSALSIAVSSASGSTGGTFSLTFTVAQNCILYADDIATTGGDMPYTMEMRSNSAVLDWDLSKYGYYSAEVKFSYTGNYTYPYYLPSPAPLRIKLPAGTYTFVCNFESGNYTAKTLSTVFNLIPAETGKVFTSTYAYPSIQVLHCQGRHTKKLVFAASITNNRSYNFGHTNADTDTAMRLTASSGSTYKLYIPGSNATAPPQQNAGFYIGAGTTWTTGGDLTGSRDFTVWALPANRVSENMSFAVRSPGVSTWSLEILS
jgi:hypothetical protein